MLLAQAEIARGAMSEKTESQSAPTRTDSKPTAEPKLVQDAHRSATPAAPKTAEPIVCGIPRELWSDPDVRWLTGVHDAGESTYVVCEPYEELLWWLQMPELLSIAGQASPGKSEVRALSTKVHEASAAADKAGYRLQTMLGIDAKKPETPANPIEKDAAGSKATKAGESAGNDSLADPLKSSEELPANPNR